MIGNIWVGNGNRLRVTVTGGLTPKPAPVFLVRSCIAVFSTFAPGTKH